MEHIKIEQNSNIEIVDSNIISKLAEASQDCDASSNMTGNLQTANAYEDDVNFLTNRFPGLSINVTQGLYLRIADPAVQNILATNFGDGTGITKAQAQSLQHFNSKFAGNTDIETFNELSKFTNITEINYNNRFNGCTKLKEIDLSNITKISGSNGYERWNFEYCSNLEDVGSTANCTYFGMMAFINCAKLVDGVDLSNATFLGGSAFEGCTSLVSVGSLANIQTISKSAFNKARSISSFENLSLPSLSGVLEASAFNECTQIVNVVDLGNITTFGSTDGGNEGSRWSPFSQCSNLETIVLPATLTTVGDTTNHPNQKMRWIKILAAAVPTIIWNSVFGYRENNGTYNGATYPIYVKDDIWNDYLADAKWVKFYNAGRLKKLSEFATDFPND